MNFVRSLKGNPEGVRRKQNEICSSLINKINHR